MEKSFLINFFKRKKNILSFYQRLQQFKFLIVFHEKKNKTFN